jgi:hypothetical protein
MTPKAALAGESLFFLAVAVDAVVGVAAVAAAAEEPVGSVAVAASSAVVDTAAPVAVVAALAAVAAVAAQRQVWVSDMGLRGRDPLLVLAGSPEKEWPYKDLVFVPQAGTLG